MAPPKNVFNRDFGCSFPAEDWDNFIKDNAEYRKKGLEAMGKINEIHQWGRYLESINSNTTFLAKLDPISSAIKIFCWLVGGTIVLTSVAVGAKIMLTPTAIVTGSDKVIIENKDAPE